VNNLSTLLSRSHAFEQRASAIVVVTAQLQEALKLISEYKELVLAQNAQLAQHNKSAAPSHDGQPVQVDPPGHVAGEDRPNPASGPGTGA
jgi:hypothetical protein